MLIINKRVKNLSYLLFFIFLISFISADSFGYDTDDIINSLFGYDTRDISTFEPTYVSSHTNNTIAVSGAGNWMNVTFDNEEDEFKKRIIHTTNDVTNYTFTIADDGLYLIMYTLSFQDSAAAPPNHIVVRVLNNNVELNGFTQEEDSTIQNAEFNIVHGDYIELNNGDEIVLQFTSDATTVSLNSHLTYGVHRNTGHINIKRAA